jgi:hypothetical protein
MREKFKNAKEPSKLELNFIERMENAYVGYNEITLEDWYKVPARTLRKWKERYNSFKYIGITPQGKMICRNSIYQIVRPNSPQANKIRLQAKFDKLCAILDEYNTRRLLGEILCSGQEQLQIDRILKEANELEEVLRTIEKLQ